MFALSFISDGTMELSESIKAISSSQESGQLADNTRTFTTNSENHVLVSCSNAVWPRLYGRSTYLNLQYFNSPEILTRNLTFSRMAFFLKDLCKGVVHWFCKSLRNSFFKNWKKKNLKNAFCASSKLFSRKWTAAFWLVLNHVIMFNTK